MGVTDVLLSYLYDLRITEGDGNCESEWNINKLSGTLSCHIMPKEVNSLLIGFYR